MLFCLLLYGTIFLIFVYTYCVLLIRNINITESLDPLIDIKARIEVARRTFKTMTSLFCNNLMLVLLYRVESWSLYRQALEQLRLIKLEHAAGFLKQ